jgi:hypothetical protein
VLGKSAPLGENCGSAKEPVVGKPGLIGKLGQTDERASPKPVAESLVTHATHASCRGVNRIADRHGHPVNNPKGGQPGASWDPSGHFDTDDGNGNRNRISPNGNPVDHNNNPILGPGPNAPGIARIIILIGEWLWPILVFP